MREQADFLALHRCCLQDRQISWRSNAFVLTSSGQNTQRGTSANIKKVEISQHMLQLPQKKLVLQTFYATVSLHLNYGPTTNLPPDTLINSLICS